MTWDLSIHSITKATVVVCPVSRPSNRQMKPKLSHLEQRSRTNFVFKTQFPLCVPNMRAHTAFRKPESRHKRHKPTEIMGNNVDNESTLNFKCMSQRSELSCVVRDGKERYSVACFDVERHKEGACALSLKFPR
jgi:hypothetical protein